MSRTKYQCGDLVNVCALIDIPTKDKLIFKIVGVWVWQKFTKYYMVCTTTKARFTCTQANMMRLVKRGDLKWAPQVTND